MSVPRHEDPPGRRPPLPSNPPQLNPPQLVPDRVVNAQGGQRQRRPQSNTPSTNPGIGVVPCDSTCDCDTFTGSELEKVVEEKGKKILVVDLKHFFRRGEDGTWICKKCE